jgi:hypothetical protein
MKFLFDQQLSRKRVSSFFTILTSMSDASFEEKDG